MDVVYITVIVSSMEAVCIVLFHAGNDILPVDGFPNFRTPTLSNSPFVLIIIGHASLLVKNYVYKHLIYLLLKNALCK